MDILTGLGELFLERNQIDSAVESFESALEQANKLYPGQQHVANALNRLGIALHQAGNLHKSLGYLQEAKKILDDHSEDEGLTRTVLNNIGTIHDQRGELLLALQVYTEALGTNASGKHSELFYGNIVNTMRRLYKANVSQFGMLPENKKDKAFETHGKVAITKDTCPAFVDSFYFRGLVKNDEERDEMLKYLEVARQIAERFDYKCGRVVLVLLLFSMKYGETGSFEKSRSYYEEAKKMAKSLPLAKDDSIVPCELDMIEIIVLKK